MRNFFGIFLLMFIFCSQLSAQKQLTLEDFFVDGTFRTKGVYGLRSMNDGEHYTVLENNGTRIVKYSYKTGLPVATLLDLKTQEDSPVSRIDDYTFNADESRILICTKRNRFTAVRSLPIIIFSILKIKKSNLCRKVAANGWRLFLRPVCKLLS